MSSLQAQNTNDISFEGPDGKEMKLHKYFIVFLLSGDRRDQAADEVEKIQNAHILYLTSLWEQGIILLNGPFDDDGAMRGMSVYKVKSAEQAREYAENDPSVKAGRLKIEVHPWWSAPFTPQFEK
ncbi:MAG: hypothetical protein KDC13_06395 [Bacteroidetes bacterium]|nr:hypothetical protein [Bacteroidota bacterium]